MITLLIFSSLILCIIIVIMVSILQKRVNFENTHERSRYYINDKRP